MGVISTIEDALLAAVETALGSTVRKKESLPGGWTSDMLTRALQASPGVYAAFQGGRRGAGDGYQSGRFTVYVVAKGAREAERRRGNSRVIGVYEMLELLLPPLDGLAIPDIGTMEVTGIDNLFRDAMFDLGGTVYGIGLTLPNMPFDYLTDTTSLDDFITFDATYDIDTTQDGEPVAEDQVTGLDKL